MPTRARMLTLPGETLILTARCGDRGGKLSQARSVTCRCARRHRVESSSTACCSELGRRQCNDVLVEAGPTLAGCVHRSRIGDELVLYVAPMLLGPDARPMAKLPCARAAGRRAALRACEPGAHRRRSQADIATESLQSSPHVHRNRSNRRRSAALTPRGGDVELLIAAPLLDSSNVAIGDSIAVSGCCLTVTRLHASGSPRMRRVETLNVTTLGAVARRATRQSREGAVRRASRSAATTSRATSRRCAMVDSRSGRAVSCA